MGRTLEELDRALTALKSEVEGLQRQQRPVGSPLRRFAGFFTNDADWAAIHEQIEARRRQADTELAGS